MTLPKKIGIFDSGIGGLTVLRSLVEAYPHQDFIYIGDLARLPYGNKSPATIRKYGEQMIEKLIELGADDIIIACNSASTVFLGENHFQGHSLFNVIEPGAKAALSISQTKHIGVLGTRATIESHAYQNMLNKVNHQVVVTEIACPLLVPFAEEGLEGNKLTKEVIKLYVHNIDQMVDTIILGCTHYPILKNDIQEVVGDKIKLVESGEVLKEIFSSRITSLNHGSGQLEIYATDLTTQFKTMACNLIPRTTELNIRHL